MKVENSKKHDARLGILVLENEGIEFDSESAGCIYVLYNLWCWFCWNNMANRPGLRWFCFGKQTSTSRKCMNIETIFKNSCRACATDSQLFAQTPTHIRYSTFSKFDLSFSTRQCRAPKTRLARVTPQKNWELWTGTQILRFKVARARSRFSFERTWSLI